MAYSPTIMAKLQRHLIELNEIPATGKSYSFDRSIKEVAEGIEDLIKGADFTFNFTILPIGQAFELTGELKTQMPLLCSRCGIDINYPIKSRAHEILLIQEEWPRGTQSAKSKNSDWESANMNCYFLKSGELNVAELLHELIATQEPLQPVRSEACYTNCENYLEVLKNGWLKEDSTEAKNTHSPFATLKDLIKENELKG
jgi:uncharacterized protein